MRKDADQLITRLPVVLRAAVEVERSARDVWAFVRDMENYVRWFPGIMQMQAVDSQPVATVGKRYAEIAIMPGGKEERINVTIVAADEEAMHLAIEASLAPVLPRFDYKVFQLESGRSRFEWVCRGRGTSAMAAVGRRVMPLILRPRLDRALANFKRIQEAHAETCMQAAQFFRFGEADAVMRVEPCALKPSPGKGEVLVQQLASSINQIDGHRRKGYGRNVMRARGALNFPVVLGEDVSGVVTAVGEGTSGFSVGDRVFGVKPPSSQGAFAAFVSVKSANLVRMPTNLSAQNAAALPYAFVTAWCALVRDARLRRSDRVFVQGGAGAVGSMAVQLAKARGCRVVASCLPGQASLAQSLGADAVIEAGGAAFDSLRESFDVVLCAATSAEEQRLLSLLKVRAGARYVSVIHPTLQLTDEMGLLKGFTTAKAQLKALNAALKPKQQLARWTLFSPAPKAIAEMATLAASGALKPIIDSAFPLDAIAQAMNCAESGQATGKVIVTFPSML